MPPTFPFWFKQRQCKAEPHGDHMLKVTGPILPEAYVFIGPAGDGRWRAGLRFAPDGEDVAVNEPGSATAREAWDAALELYRNHVIV